jgi:hypothetical protein
MAYSIGLQHNDGADPTTLQYYQELVKTLTVGI